MRETDRETLNELAGRLIDPENLAIVIVGDVPEIRAELESLEIPIRLLDAEGREIDEP